MCRYGHTEGRQGSGEELLALRAWYASSAGALLLGDVKLQLERMLPDLFGYHALQLGQVNPDIDLLEASRIRHRVCMDRRAGAVGVIGACDALPFDADSLDLVVAMHALDFADEPREILREVERVLIPEGHMIVVGFNALSLYGAWRLFARAGRRAPWSGHFYTATQLRDWLRPLGIEPQACQHVGFRPPMQRGGLGARLAFMERWGARLVPGAGGVYVLLARKRVANVTPLRPRWRPRRRLLAGDLTEPSARSLRRADAG